MPFLWSDDDDDTHHVITAEADQQDRAHSPGSQHPLILADPAQAVAKLACAIQNNLMAQLEDTTPRTVDNYTASNRSNLMAVAIWTIPNPPRFRPPGSASPSPDHDASRSEDNCYTRYLDQAVAAFGNSTCANQYTAHNLAIIAENEAYLAQLREHLTASMPPTQRDDSYLLTTEYVAWRNSFLNIVHEAAHKLAHPPSEHKVHCSPSDELKRAPIFALRPCMPSIPHSNIAENGSRAMRECITHEHSLRAHWYKQLRSSQQNIMRERLANRAPRSHLFEFILQQSDIRRDQVYVQQQLQLVAHRGELIALLEAWAKRHPHDSDQLHPEEWNKRNPLPVTTSKLRDLQTMQPGAAASLLQRWSAWADGMEDALADISDQHKGSGAVLPLWRHNLKMERDRIDLVASSNRLLVANWKELAARQEFRTLCASASSPYGNFSLKMYNLRLEAGNSASTALLQTLIRAAAKSTLDVLDTQDLGTAAAIRSLQKQQRAWIARLQRVIRKLGNSVTEVPTEKLVSIELTIAHLHHQCGLTHSGASLESMVSELERLTFCVFFMGEHGAKPDPVTVTMDQERQAIDNNNQALAAFWRRRRHHLTDEAHPTDLQTGGELDLYQQLASDNPARTHTGTPKRRKRAHSTTNLDPAAPPQRTKHAAPAAAGPRAHANRITTARHTRRARTLEDVAAHAAVLFLPHIAPRVAGTRCVSAAPFSAFNVKLLTEDTDTSSPSTNPSLATFGSTDTPQRHLERFVKVIVQIDLSQQPGRQPADLDPADTEPQHGINLSTVILNTVISEIFVTKFDPNTPLDTRQLAAVCTQVTHPRTWPTPLIPRVPFAAPQLPSQDLLMFWSEHGWQPGLCINNKEGVLTVVDLAGNRSRRWPPHLASTPHEHLCAHYQRRCIEQHNTSPSYLTLRQRQNVPYSRFLCQPNRWFKPTPGSDSNDDTARPAFVEVIEHPHAESTYVATDVLHGQRWTGPAHELNDSEYLDGPREPTPPTPGPHPDDSDSDPDMPGLAPSSEESSDSDSSDEQDSGEDGAEGGQQAPPRPPINDSALSRRIAWNQAAEAMLGPPDTTSEGDGSPPPGDGPPGPNSTHWNEHEMGSSVADTTDDEDAPTSPSQAGEHAPRTPTQIQPQVEPVADHEFISSADRLRRLDIFTFYFPLPNRHLAAKKLVIWRTKLRGVLHATNHDMGTLATEAASGKLFDNFKADLHDWLDTNSIPRYNRRWHLQPVNCTNDLEWRTKLEAWLTDKELRTRVVRLAYHLRRSMWTVDHEIVQAYGFDGRTAASRDQQAIQQRLKEFDAEIHLLPQQPGAWIQAPVKEAGPHTPTGRSAALLQDLLDWLDDHAMPKRNPLLCVTPPALTREQATQLDEYRSWRTILLQHCAAHYARMLLDMPESQQERTALERDEAGAQRLETLEQADARYEQAGLDAQLLQTRVDEWYAAEPDSSAPQADFDDWQRSDPTGAAPKHPSKLEWKDWRDAFPYPQAYLAQSNYIRAQHSFYFTQSRFGRRVFLDLHSAPFEQPHDAVQQFMQDTPQPTQAEVGEMSDELAATLRCDWLVSLTKVFTEQGTLLEQLDRASEQYPLKHQAQARDAILATYRHNHHELARLRFDHRHQMAAAGAEPTPLTTWVRAPTAATETNLTGPARQTGVNSRVQSGQLAQPWQERTVNFAGQKGRKNPANQRATTTMRAHPPRAAPSHASSTNEPHAPTRASPPDPVTDATQQGERQPTTPPYSPSSPSYNPQSPPTEGHNLKPKDELEQCQQEANLGPAVRLLLTDRDLETVFKPSTIITVGTLFRGKPIKETPNAGYPDKKHVKPVTIPIASLRAARMGKVLLDGCNAVSGRQVKHGFNIRALIDISGLTASQLEGMTPTEEQANAAGAAPAMAGRATEAAKLPAAPISPRRRQSLTLFADDPDEHTLDQVQATIKEIYRAKGIHFDDDLFKAHLRNRDFTFKRGDEVENILHRIVHDTRAMKGKRNKSKEQHLSNFLTFVKDRCSQFPDAEKWKVVIDYILHKHQQLNAKKPHRTHALDCRWDRKNENGVLMCGRDLPVGHPNRTNCDDELAHGTVENMLSMLATHKDTPPVWAQAFRHEQVRLMQKRTKRKQRDCGRDTKKADFMEEDEVQAFMTDIQEQIRECKAASGDNLLQLILLTAFMSLIAFIWAYGYRAAEALRVELGKMKILVSKDGSMVETTKIDHTKVVGAQSDPRAMAVYTPGDNFGAFNSVAALLRLYEEQGLDELKESRYAFHKVTKVNGYYQPVMATDERPSPTYEPQDFQALVKKTASRIGLWTEGRKFSIKSLRVSRTAMGAAAGLNEEEINKAMGWEAGSDTAKNYCSVVRAIHQPPPSLTPQQFKMLRQAKLYSIDEWAIKND